MTFLEASITMFMVQSKNMASLTVIIYACNMFIALATGFVLG